jgi:hypothetical protein
MKQILKIRRNFIFLIFCVLVFFAKTQTNIPSFIESTLILVSEDKNGNATKYSIGNAYMILNLSTGDFILNADLSGLRTGNKKIDSLINKQGDQTLSYKGNIGENLQAFNQQQNDEKMYSMSGVFSLNGNSFTSQALFDPINPAEKSESKNYRLDFTMSVDPSRFTIKGLEDYFAKQIVFEIVKGKLNIQQ